MKKILVIIVALVSLFFVPTVILAAGDNLIESGLDSTAVNAKLIESASDKAGTLLAQEKVGQLIQSGIGLLGIVMMIITLYSGFLWMTAGGNETQTKKARNWIIYSALGLLIMGSAYALAHFALSNILEQIG